MPDFVKFSLSAEQLIARAREDTGIEIEDLDAIEPLTVLVQSLNEEGDMHEEGANELQLRVLQMLKNRLRMLRDFRDHPEIAEQQVKAPIIISGTFRTGSTKLQRVLSESGDFNWLPFSSAYNFASFTGEPHEDLVDRIAEVQAYVDYNDRVSPNLRIAHELHPDKPEEDVFIAVQSFRSTAWFGYGKVPSYLQWVSQQDMTQTFAFVRDALKYLQWQGLADPNKRWVLKTPLYLGFEDVVQRIFPDACFVVTHRPVSQTIASLCSLLTWNVHCYANNPQADSQSTMLGQTMTLERHMQIRKANPHIPMLDIHYKESTTDLRSVVQKIYEFAGEPLSDQSLKRMLDWDANNPIHQHGVHSYSLADFGLTEHGIESQCPNYSAFYAAKFGE